jgi:hypothetical protein
LAAITFVSHPINTCITNGSGPSSVLSRYWRIRNIAR